jgi:hypothetical protein
MTKVAMYVKQQSVSHRMNISQLSSLIETLPTQGLSLSQIETLKIQCSLRLLQNQMKCEHIFFFGKVLGVYGDYYLAFSTDPDNFMPAIFFCSQDCSVWFSLTGIDPVARDEVTALDSPFSGSLITEFELPSGAIITEEQRLAGFVGDVSEKCFLIPRGYAIQTALKAVLKNPTWVGSPIQTYRTLSNLRHWRTGMRELSAVDKTFSNPAVDFLESFNDPDDWMFDFAGENEELRLRSLRWPGFTFYLCDTVFANFYFGQAIACTDVAEILSQKTEARRAHETIPLTAKH